MYNLPFFRTKQDGFSLIEILMSLSLFSVAMIGLYFAFTSVSTQTAKGLKGDIEAAYAKLLIGQVNIYDIDVETAYDVTSKTATTLPDGTTAYYTRDVRSEAETPDIKKVSVYFYKNSTDTTPYRNFTKEFAPNTWYYDFGHTTHLSTIWVDSLGNKYTHIDQNDLYTTATAGSYKFGMDNTLNGGTVTSEWQDGSTNGGIVNGSVDNYAYTNTNLNAQQWRRAARGSAGSSNDLYFRLPASMDYSYKVTLGFNEAWSAVTAAGDRSMTWAINGTTVETIDVFNEVGKYTTLTKTYTATPAADGNGVYNILFGCTNNGGVPCMISWISLERL